ncbi:isoquinoline 1-oxidoreductase [Thioclava sp. SK-1]|nr:isoquinoline 1-oxidoreductase [Thioclava sp. SK-1]
MIKGLIPGVDPQDFTHGAPVNLSRRSVLRGALGIGAGAMVLGFGLPSGTARAQAAATMAPGSNVPAFLEIRPDSTVRLLSPFVEGGQGIFTGMAQIIGEELDADPSSFIVENAPAGADYLVIGGQMRITGGSMSVRMSYPLMRKLGASARAMLITAAADQLQVPASELTTEPGVVIHAGSNRRIAYGDLATAAFDLPVPDPETVALRDPATFRWIRQPVKRLDVYDKSTGRAEYSIDVTVDGMLHGAVQHAPRLGLMVETIRNRDQVAALPGVHAVEILDGAVAVVAQRWWTAKRAVEALEVDWVEGTDLPKGWRALPADFSSDAFAQELAAATGPETEAEAHGDAPGVLDAAQTVISATYHSQYLHHAQLEPPSTLARFNPDGTLDLWLPNQAPEQYQAAVAGLTGLEPAQINIHSPILGGFFGRHFLYPAASAYPQAIELARRTGRPVKVIWTREQEFLRDPMRPMAAVRFRGTLDDNGMPLAIEAVSATEGPTEAVYGHGDSVDETAVEGLSKKAYAIPNLRIAQVYVENPVMLAYWRSVGNSMNDFFYESFLDELANAGGQDPLALRKHLLRDTPRLTKLLEAVVDLSGGWKRGPFTAEDGSMRARGIGMASPFGSEAAAIAEVSIENGQVRVHDIWEVLDPGAIVNPMLVRQQIRGAAALGLSQVLMEEARWDKGEPVARNYDMYSILPPDQMPEIHVGILESGAPIGGVGEPPLPAVPPAVANAVAALTGKPVRRMPLSRLRFDS